jgi:hypothetical protein
VVQPRPTRHIRGAAHAPSPSVRDLSTPGQGVGSAGGGGVGDPCRWVCQTHKRESRHTERASAGKSFIRRVTEKVIGVLVQVEELALELEAMYKVLDTLLPKLPHPFKLDLQKGPSADKLPEGIAA